MFNTIVTVIGALILALGLGSKWLERTPVPATLLALLAGVLVGPAVLHWVDPAALGERPVILERAARLTLGIGLVSVALRIPKEYPRRHWREMITLISLGMVLMWGLSTAVVHLVLGLPLALAAVIGAAVTATDPIAATPIVTGRLAEQNLPDRMRRAISFESGANDGLAYLFVFLPFLLLTRPAEEAVSHWLVHTLLWEVGAATAFGIALGWAAGRSLQAAERRDLIQEDWRMVYVAAMALLAVGAGRLIRSDEVLLVFAAGAAFAQVVGPDDRKAEEHGQEAVNRFFSIPIFALIGTALPWRGWAEMGWKGPLVAVLLLLLRRPPVLLLLRPVLPSVRSTRDALYMGWFGPIAVAAAYYAALMEHRLHEPRIWHVASLAICASVIAHGMTAAPLTRLYGRTAASHEETSPDG
ncbi:MAG TPA: cation:proton antiporter [Actinomycetota bacterium]|nr:cation:proton antiporter [Actinomycetota bacterium]